MQKLFTFILTALIISAGSLAHAADQWKVSQEKSSVGFLIQSTLHNAEGKARTLSGFLDNENNTAQGSVNIDILGLTSANDKRDKNMYEMFDAAKNKTINFTFNGTNMGPFLSRNGGEIAFTGKLTIHNVTRPIILITEARLDGNALTCTGKMIVHLKDYDLKPPSVLGLIKVKDDVPVHFSITFVKTGAAQ